MVDIDTRLALSSGGTAFVDAIGRSISIVVDFTTDILGKIANQLIQIVSNPLWLVSTILLVLVFAFSIVWVPYHPVILQGVQIAHNDVVRPIARDFVVPVLRVLAPVYERVAAWWNFYQKLWTVFFIDFVTIPLRCTRTPAFVRVLLHSLVPFARGVALLFRMLIMATLGHSPWMEDSQIATGLIFGSAANVTDAASEVVGCYCDLLAHYIDFVPLLLMDKNIQCTVSNVVGIAFEIVTQSTRVLYAEITYWLHVVRWLLCIVLYGLSVGTIPCDLTFPRPNLYELLPDLNIILDRLGSGICCATDATDCILNTLLDTGVDMLNTIPEVEDLGIEEPDYIKFVAPVKGVAPVAIEAIRIGYDVLLTTANGTFNYSNILFDRAWTATAKMCDVTTDSMLSYGPHLSHVALGGLMAIETPLGFGTTSALGLLYGPRIFNHTCLAIVTLAHGIVDIATQVRDYDDYTSGKYLDCFLHEIRTAAHDAEEDVTQFLDFIPTWRNCTIIPTEVDEYGTPKVFGFPRPDCPSLFDINIGKFAASPIHLASAILDYVVDVSEHASSFDEARNVSLGCIFDKVNDGIRAAARVLADVIDLVPGSVADEREFLGLSLNMTGEVGKWLTHDPSPNILDFLETIKNINQDVTEVFDFFPNATIDAPHVGPRTFGLLDVIPIVFSARTLPIALEELGVGVVELTRFVVDVLRTGDYTEWEFSQEALTRLLRAEMNLADALAESASGPLCALHEAVAGSANYTQPPDCPFFVDVPIINFTLCPANLIPCPKVPLQHVGYAAGRLLEILVLIKPVFYSSTFGAELLDPVICELETASAELEIALAEWEFAMRIPYWNTDLTLDVPAVLSGITYTGAKILGFMNKILVEAVHLATRERGHVSGCTDDEPCMIGGDCKACTSTACCPTGTFCCPITGYCATHCFDTTGILRDLHNATGAFAAFVDHLAEPLGVIDPSAEQFASILGQIPAQLVQSVLHTVLTVAVPGASWSDNLAEITCVLDDAALALGRGVTVIVAVGVRTVGTILNATGHENKTIALMTNMGALSDGIAGLMLAIGGVLAEAVSVVLRIVGSIFDAGEFQSFSDWLSAATVGLCHLSKAIGLLPDAAAAFVRSLDITGHDAFCTLSTATRSVFALVHVTLEQLFNLIGGVLNVSEPLGWGFNLTAWFDAIRSIVVEIGNLVSWLLYALFGWMGQSESAEETIRRLFETIGLCVAALLNVIVSIFEGIANLFAIFLDSFGQGFGFGDLFCASDLEPTDIFMPFIEALLVALRSLANLFDYILPPLAKAMRIIADLLELLFNPGSLAWEFLGATFNVLIEFVNLIVGLFTGDLSNIVDFVEAVIAWIKIAWRFMLQLIAGFIDNVIFRGANVVGCLVDFRKCIKDLVKKIFGIGRSLETVTEDGVPLSQRLAQIALKFPEGDTCRKAFFNLSRIYLEYERTNPAGAADPDAEGPYIDWMMRLRIGACSLRLEQEGELDRTTAETEIRDPACEGTNLLEDPVCTVNAIELTRDVIWRITNTFAERLVENQDIAAYVQFARERGAIYDKQRMAGRDAQSLADWFVEMMEMTNRSSVRIKLTRALRATGGHKVDTVIGRITEMAEVLQRIGTKMVQEPDPTPLSTTALPPHWSARDREWANKCDWIGMDTNADPDELIIFMNSGRRGARWRDYTAVWEEPRGLDPPQIGETYGRRAFIATRGAGDWMDEVGQDECNHSIRGGLGLFSQGDGLSGCPPTCPNCTDANVIFSVPPICPIASCPAVLAAHPELQSLCARRCDSAIYTDVFENLCVHKCWHPTSSSSDYVEIWTRRRIASIRKIPVYGGEHFDWWWLYDPYATEQTIHAFEVEMIMDPDNLAFLNYTAGIKTYALEDPFSFEWIFGFCNHTEPGNQCDDVDQFATAYQTGPLTSGDLCTHIGRYGVVQREFCETKCDRSNPNSMLYWINHAGIGLLSRGAQQLLYDVCGNFCAQYDPFCTTKKNVFDCRESGSAAATCYQMCDLAWVTTSEGLIPTLPMESCMPQSLTCYTSTISGSTFEELFGRSCNCTPPPGPNGTEYCRCDYQIDVGLDILSGLTADGTRLPFVCPNTFRRSDFTFIAKYGGSSEPIDYPTMSTALRPTKEHIYTEPINQTFTTGLELAGTYTYNHGILIGGTFEEGLRYRLSSKIRPRYNESHCQNYTTNKTRTLCGMDYVCDHPESPVCVPQLICGPWHFAQTMAVETYADIKVNISLPISWVGPMLQTSSTRTASDCVDTGGVGWCSSYYCYTNATYMTPTGPVCDSELHCARGVWCPSNPSCELAGWTTFNTTTNPLEYSFDDARVDYITSMPNAELWTCRWRYMCTGPNWCMNVSLFANNATGDCPTTNAGTYLGHLWMESDNQTLPTWQIDFDRACLNESRGCIEETITCLNYTNPAGTDVRLCTQINACFNAPGCNDTTRSCLYCDQCPSCPECSDCILLDVCAVVKIYPLDNATSVSSSYVSSESNASTSSLASSEEGGGEENVHQFIQIFQICTQGGTNVSCHERYACGEPGTVEVQFANCTEVEIAPTEYPDPSSAWTRGTDAYGDYGQIELYLALVSFYDFLPNDGFPMSWIGEGSCDNPDIHTGDLCSYLCEDDTTGTSYDCDALFDAGGIDCAHYTGLPTATWIYGAAGARRWFCQVTYQTGWITRYSFPMAGPGVVTYAEEVASITNSPYAQSCQGHVQSGLACVLLGPGEGEAEIMASQRLTDEECERVAYYVEHSPFLEYYRFTTNDVTDTAAEKFCEDYASRTTATTTQLEPSDPPRPYDLTWHVTNTSGFYTLAGGYVGAEEGVGDGVGYGSDIPPPPPLLLFAPHPSPPPGRITREPSVPEPATAFSLDVIREITRLRRLVGSVTDDEWRTILQMTYGNDGSDIRLDDALAYGWAIARNGERVCRPMADYCGPPRLCGVVRVEPTVCTRNDPPPPPLAPTCVPRQYQCPGIVTDDPCVDWYGAYAYVPDDPEAEYLASGFGDCELPNTTGIQNASVEMILDNIDNLRNFIAELTGRVGGCTRDENGIDTCTKDERKAAMGKALARMYVRLQQRLELSTCAALPNSAACKRIHAQLMPPMAKARTIYEANVVARAAIEWLPPPERRSCYLLCRDWVDVMRLSCIEQAEGPNGLVMLFVTTVQEVLQAICSELGIGNGTDYVTDMTALLPDVSRLNIMGVNAAPGTIGIPPRPATTSRSCPLMNAVRKLSAKSLNCLFGWNVSSSLSPEEIVLELVAKAVNATNGTTFLNETLECLKNTNRNPDAGDVGALYWLLLPTAFGASCAGLNGTHKICNIPFYSPFWFPKLPLSIANFTIDIVTYLANLEWVVPTDMIIDPGGCYMEEQLAIPLTTLSLVQDEPRSHPCSPTFGSCFERIGITGPIDTLSFLVNWLFPNAYKQSWLRAIAGSYLTKFADVRTSSQFHGQLYCALLVGLVSLLWVVPFIGIVIILLRLIGKLIVIWATFAAAIIWAGIVWFISRECEYVLQHIR